LEVTGVTNDIVSLNLNNATNQVYEIFSKSDFSQSNWDIETEVFPTNAVNNPFTISEQGRSNLVIWARDWTDVTSGGNTIPEWWFYSTVTAQSDGSIASVVFNVVAPSGIGNVYDESDPGFQYSGTEVMIGAQTEFAFNLLPTTVRFANIHFRESFLASAQVTWPNGIVTQQPATNIDFPIPGDCISYNHDNISYGPIPYSRLYNGTNYVDVTFPRDWVDQYLNASSNWVNFANMEVINKFFGTTGGAQEIYLGVPGALQGPWQ
jgi:hypothetical protein